MLIRNNAKQQPDGYLDRTPIFQFILLSVLFPMWGAAAGLNDILITQFKHVFDLSDAATAFVQSAFYGGYFIVAIPASRFIRRTSYKVGIITGLIFYIIGCGLFFPASHVGTYLVFLGAIFAVAVGLSFLETAANTFSSMLGPKKNATLRLNISQTFTPLGNLAGIILGKYLIFDQAGSIEKKLEGTSGQERQTLVDEMLSNTLRPYAFILVVLVGLLVLFLITQYPSGRAESDSSDKDASLKATLRYLSQNTAYLKGIVAQFLYVGLQTAVWSFTIRLALETQPDLTDAQGANYMIAGFLCFLLGKIPANFLMQRFNPSLVMIVYCALGVLVLLFVAFGPEHQAVWGAVAASLLMGPMWPTIFGKTLDTITDKRFQETGGAVLVMAIVGGAVIPVIQGWVSDRTGSMQISFLVSAACFVGIMIYFIDQLKHPERDVQREAHEVQEEHSPDDYAERTA